MIWKPGMLVHSPSRASKIRQPNATNSATTAKQDMSSSNVVIENEVHNNKYTKPTSTTKTANNSASLTIFLLINSMIGSGILNQPYVFMKSGLLGALFGYMIVILGTWSGLFLLTEAGIISNNFDFSSLARESLGVEGEQLVDGSIILMASGSILSYIIIIGETSHSLVEGLGCHNVLCDQFSMTILCVILFVIPMCMSRSLGNLARASVLSIIAILGCLVMVVIYGPTSAVSTDASRAPVVLFDTLGTCMSTGSIILALNCSSANFHAYLSTSKDARSITSWMRISGIAVTIGSTICVSMGLSGYLAFRNDTDGEILNNFPHHQYDLVKLMIVGHLILYIPMQFIVLRHSVVRQIWRTNSEDLIWSRHVTLTVGLLSMMTAFVLHLVSASIASGTAFTFIVNLTGGVSGSLLTFILPGVIYRRVTKSSPSTLSSALSRNMSVSSVSGSFLSGTLLAGEVKRFDHRDRMRLMAQFNILLGFILMITIVTATLIDTSAYF